MVDDMRVDGNGNTVEVGRGQYDNKVTSSETPIIELNAVFPLSFFRDRQSTTGSGSITDNESEYQLTHTGSGDVAILLSAKRGRYLPGTAGEAGIGWRQPSSFTDGDGTFYWGYFDREVNESGVEQDSINDGFVFGSDTTGTFVAVYKAGEEKHKTYQTNWNIDDYPTLDLTKGQQYQILFNYYGYGLIIWKVVDSDSGKELQRIRNLHSWSPDGETSIDNTNLQVGAMVKSSNSSDNLSGYIGGRKFSVYGRYKPEARNTTHTLLNKSVTTSATYTPVMSFRRKFTSREIVIEAEDFDAITNNDIDVQIWIGGSLTGASWEDPDGRSSVETGLEVDTSATAHSETGAELFDTDFVVGGAGNQSGSQTKTVSLPRDIPDEEIIVFKARAIGGTDATVDFKARIREVW